MELPTDRFCIFPTLGEEVLQSRGLGNRTFGVDTDTIETIIAKEFYEFFYVFEFSAFFFHQHIYISCWAGVIASPRVEEDETAAIGYTVAVSNVAVCTRYTYPRERPAALRIHVGPHTEIIAVEYISR